MVESSLYKPTLNHWKHRKTLCKHVTMPIEHVHYQWTHKALLATLPKENKPNKKQSGKRWGWSPLILWLLSHSKWMQIMRCPAHRRSSRQCLIDTMLVLSLTLRYFCLTLFRCITECYSNTNVIHCGCSTKRSIIESVGMSRSILFRA